MLFSARNDHDLYDCASKRRTGEFSLICGYFLFVDRKIGYRLKDLRMKCNSLIKDYVSISIPVFVSDSLLALGTSAVAMVMGRIGTGKGTAAGLDIPDSWPGSGHFRRRSDQGIKQTHYRTLQYNT